MDVSFVIVNYNTTHLVRACIESIYRFTKQVSFEVWIVDNLSSDTSFFSLQQQFPGINILVMQENAGFGKANNAAIYKAKGKFLFLLNPDTELESDAAAVFTGFMNNPLNKEVAVCGGHLHTGTNKQTPSYGNFPSLLQAVSSTGLFYLYRNYYRNHIDTGVVNTEMHERKVDFVSGADLFIRKEALDKCGAFDPDFFLYFEEVELCKRIRNQGYTVMLLPGVKILHHEGGSAVKRGFNPFSFYHFERSRKLYYQKVHGKLYAGMASLFHLTNIILKSIAGNNNGNIYRKIRLFYGIDKY